MKFKKDPLLHNYLRMIRFDLKHIRWRQAYSLRPIIDVKGREITRGREIAKWAKRYKHEIQEVTPHTKSTN